MKKNILLLSVLVLALGLSFVQAEASIVVKTRAVNPLEEDAITPVKAYLPEGATPKDILSYSEEWRAESGEITTKFDKDKGQFYIEKEITLGPKKFVVLEVEIEDIWVIDEVKLSALRDKANNAAFKVSGKNRKGKTRKRKKTFKALKEEIFSQLDGIIKKQNKNTVARAGVDRHLKAYKENKKELKQVEDDIKMLKKLGRGK